MAWKDYKPFNNTCHNTLWELARMLYDQYKQDNPTDPTPERQMVGETAIPYLVRWLFTTNGMRGDIDFTRPEWVEFINQFMSEYLNREIFSVDANIFRNKLIYILHSYKDYIESNASDAYSKILSESGSIKESGTRTNTGTENANRTDSNETKNSDEGSITGTSVTNTDTHTTQSANNIVTTGVTSEDSNTNNNTSSTNGTVKATGTSTDSGAQTNNENSRDLFSDTPQSIVNADTVGNPDLQKWTYATNLRDINRKNTSTTSNTNTRDLTDTTQSETTYTGTATSKSASNTKTTFSIATDNAADGYTDITTSQTTANTSSGTYSGTSQNKVDKNTTETYNSERDGIVPFELTKEKYQFFIEFMKKPLYNVVSELDKLFISTYVEEYRMGYLEWQEYQNITSKIYDTAEG